MKAAKILPVLLLLLLLAACGRSGTGEQSTAAPAEGAAAFPLPDPEESRAMARVIAANRVLCRGNALFCYDFDEDWLPVLARYTREDGTLRDFTVLARGCVPEYLSWLDGWLYYLDRSSGALERVPEQGGSRQLLREGPCSCLSVWEGQLCFCDGQGRFLALDPADGSETLLLEGPCSFAFPLTGAILFREEDRGRILLRQEDGSESVLSPEGASPPLLLEDRLWYSVGTRLFGQSMTGGEPLVYALPEHDGDPELLPAAQGLLLRGIRDENGPSQWEGPPEGPFVRQPRGYRICDWLGLGLQVDTVYEPDGRIRCYLLLDEGGNRLSFLAGRTS